MMEHFAQTGRRFLPFFVRGGWLTDDVSSLPMGFIRFEMKVMDS